MSAVGSQATGGGIVMIDGGSLNVSGPIAQTVVTDNMSHVHITADTKGTLNGEAVTLTSTPGAAGAAAAAGAAGAAAAVAAKTDSKVTSKASQPPPQPSDQAMWAADGAMWAADGPGVEVTVSGNDDVTAKLKTGPNTCMTVKVPPGGLLKGTIHKLDATELKHSPFICEAVIGGREVQGAHPSSTASSGKFRVRKGADVFLVQYHYGYAPSPTGFWVDGHDLPLA